MMRGFATFYVKHRITRGTEWSNIIFSVAKNNISPHGNAKFFVVFLNKLLTFRVNCAKIYLNKKTEKKFHFQKLRFRKVRL